MIKKHRNIKHLTDLIVGTINSDNVYDLSIYLNKYKPLMPNDKLDNFLNYAMSKNKLAIMLFLSEIGVVTTNYEFILRTCDIMDLEKVYKGIEQLGYKFSKNVKYNILSRLLKPYKLIDNINRMSVAINYVESGFIDRETYNLYMNQYFIEYGDKAKVIRPFLRDRILNSILN